MGNGLLSKWGKKSSRRPNVRPRWQSRQDVPRIGGRRALIASSAARFDRMEAKVNRAGVMVVVMGRIVAFVQRVLGLGPKEYKPPKPSSSYRVEVK